MIVNLYPFKKESKPFKLRKGMCYKILKFYEPLLFSEKHLVWDKARLFWTSEIAFDQL